MDNSNITDNMGTEPRGWQKTDILRFISCLQNYKCPNQSISFMPVRLMPIVIGSNIFTGKNKIFNGSKLKEIFAADGWTLENIPDGLMYVLSGLFFPTVRSSAFSLCIISNFLRLQTLAKVWLCEKHLYFAKWDPFNHSINSQGASEFWFKIR